MWWLWYGWISYARWLRLMKLREGQRVAGNRLVVLVKRHHESSCNDECKQQYCACHLACLLGAKLKTGGGKARLLVSIACGAQMFFNSTPANIVYNDGRTSIGPLRALSQTGHNPRVPKSAAKLVPHRSWLFATPTSKTLFNNSWT